ncbi:P-loop containing nucleoside triphosphate hydrolase protein [Lentinula detonsa]|uniref:Signal recognition particle receptor subunit beta n=1 Tax=Lentinula detonsa TaxID=2804962 RepID=A0A9W8TXY7_9AGAR|nr:P-loop containing nucleoside triphosphate hydrolase protein [Lentinula detonsa]
MDSEPTPVSKPESPVLISSQTLILASLFVAVISVAIFIFVSRRKGQSKRNLLLLLGPSDSGKTSIFSSLVYGHVVQTNTSMQANSSFLNIQGKRDPIQIVDVPGHPRLRDQFKDSLSSAKALAFVVDANTASRNAAVIAEHLHSVLDAIMAIPPSQPLPTLLILAHKCDLIKASSSSADTSALAVTRVQTILERELERRRSSQSGGMGVEALGDENNDEKPNMGGLDCSGPGGTFRFENWEGGEVVFLGTSVKGSEVADEKSVKGSIAPLMDWIEENI